METGFIGEFKDYNKQRKSLTILFISMAVFHIGWMLGYWFLKAYGPFVYNMFSAILYGVIAKLAFDGKNAKTLCGIVFFEFVVFTTLMNLLTGFENGFMYLVIGIMPMTFYLTHSQYNKLSISIRRCSYLVFVFFINMGLTFADFIRVYTFERWVTNVILMVNSIIGVVLMMSCSVIFVIRSSTEKQELMQEKDIFENSANYDTLTRLLNRRCLDEYITASFKSALGEGKDFSILMCDIDDFKKVNDTYGHECGDIVLREVAAKIKSALRTEDTVFRYGGEEILILVANGRDVTKIVAERCREAVESIAVQYKEQLVRVTITIGGCAYYQGATRDVMIERADENLYKGKKNGKNQVVI